MSGKFYYFAWIDAALKGFRSFFWPDSSSPFVHVDVTHIVNASSISPFTILVTKNWPEGEEQCYILLNFVVLNPGAEIALWKCIRILLVLIVFYFY